jgi:hypothetical protein
VLVVEDVGDRVDRAADDAGVVQNPVDLGGGVPPGPLGHDGLDLLLVVASVEVGLETSVVRQLRLSHRLAESAIDVVGIRRNDHPLPVRRLEDVRRRHALQTCAPRPTHDLEPVVLGDRALQQREAGLEQRHVDHLSPTEAERIALVEGREHADGSEHAGERVAERDVDAGRRLPLETVDVANAAHRLGHGGEARTRRVGARLAVARDPTHDELWIRLPQLRWADVPPLERSGPEVLDEHVAALRELEQEPLALALAQVERDALLVAALYGPPERAVVIAGLSPLTKRIRLTRRLDLDDLRAEIAQQPSGERPGEEHSELDDSNTGQRARAARVAGDLRLRHRLGHPARSRSRT